MTTWSETDALYAARKGQSLAEMMLANGAELPRVAPRTVEQIVTNAETAEQVEEDVPVVEVGEVPADAPCSHPSCAHASPYTPCRCYHCYGAGHGFITARRQEAARAKAAERTARVYGDAFGSLATGGGIYTPDEVPAARRPRGLAAITFDDDGWPID